MKNFNFNEFYKKVNQNYKLNPQWRYGQAIFNTFCCEYPHKSNLLRDSIYDPFYMNTRNATANFVKFIDHINNTKTNKIVYLGGTNSGSEWRSIFIPKLNKNITPTMIDCGDIENINYLLYCITPALINFSVIPKIFKSANEFSKKTIVCVLDEDECQDTGDTIRFSKDMKELLNYFKLMLKQKCKVFDDLHEVANYINS